MKLPQYITPEEVRRVCELLKISDWSQPDHDSVSIEEAKKILTEVNQDGMKVSAEQMQQGLDVELEHGIRFPSANVTNNHPLLTGMIVMAHLKESLDYYVRLDVAEIEGDLVKALQAGDSSKAKAKYKKLIEARRALCEAEGVAFRL